MLVKWAHVVSNWLEGDGEYEGQGMEMMLRNIVYVVGYWTYLALVWIGGCETTGFWDFRLGFILAAEEPSGELGGASVSGISFLLIE